MELRSLTRKEESIYNRLFKAKPIKRDEGDIGMFGALGMTWYFDTWFSKLVLSLAMFSLLYSIIRILVQGFW